MVNKGFISYPLLINGECVDTIIPKSAEWQVCDLSSKDQKVYLKEGNNTITVIGTQKDIPEVALVLQPTEKDNFKTNYNNYIEDLKSNIKEKVVKNKRSVDSYIHWNPDLSSFPHDYEYRLSEPIRYSFNDSYMLNMGDTIDFYIESVGHSDFTAYFFCRDNPDDYSWFEASDYGECFIHKVIPQSGVYYLYIKGLDGAGICNVTVDSSVTYENMPFNNGEIYCIQDTRYKYNTFTCHLSNDNCYPLILVKDQHERIVGFAGEIDYSYGDFNWGHNARINKNYRSPTESVIVTASTPYPLSSTGDIYIRCKNLENTWIYTHHPNLKSEDAIVSSEPSSLYNCIAWSIGIWEDSFDLTDNNQELVNEIGGRLICEDFYSDAGYIPTENPNESVIDVWSTSEIEIDAGHASVRKHLQQNPIAHGYDWESKMGSLERIFHPRFALEDTLGHYGHVAAYFKPNPYLGVRSMSERVADDEVVLENNQFTVGEIEYIMDKSGADENFRGNLRHA